MGRPLAGAGWGSPGRTISGVIHPLSGSLTWRYPFAAFALTILITTCWYGLQPVYPDCVFAYSSAGEPVNMKEAYQGAIESGQCEPPHARWSTWSG